MWEPNVACLVAFSRLMYVALQEVDILIVTPNSAWAAYRKPLLNTDFISEHL